MTDRDDSDGAISRRGFLRGEFLESGRDDQAADEAEADDGDGSVDGGNRQPPAETRGPAVELEAILDRAEEIAGGSRRSDETPHPFYQDAESGDAE